MRGDSGRDRVRLVRSEHFADVVAQVMDYVAQWRTRFPNLPVAWHVINEVEAGELPELASNEGVELRT